jgi:hypothetical protein
MLLLEHVRRDVRPVDVDAILEQRDEQAPGAARHVEHRLTVPFDLAKEERKLRGVLQEFAPALGHQAEMPDLRLVSVRIGHV